MDLFTWRLRKRMMTRQLEQTKDRVANEPLQFLVGREQLRYEVVVNFVDKDQIRGYISAPKDKSGAVRSAALGPTQ